MAKSSVTEPISDTKVTVPLHTVYKFATASLVGGFLGGIPGAISFAVCYSGARMMKGVLDSGEKHIPFVYTKSDAKFIAGEILLALGGWVGLIACQNPNDGLLSDAEERAIVRVIDGAKSAQEIASVLKDAHWGRWNKITVKTILAEQVGTDGVCSKIRITKQGDKPYMIAVRPGLSGGYESCTPPLPKKNYD